MVSIWGYNLSVTRPYRRDKGITKASAIAGLRLEPALARALTDAARSQFGGNVAATARHLLRLGLGWNKVDSLTAEEGFVRIAAERENLARSYSG